MDLLSPTNKIIYYYLIIIIVSVLCILSTINYLITIIELKDEIENIKKYISTSSITEEHRYNGLQTKINLIMNDTRIFQEELNINIKNIEDLQKEFYNREDQYIIMKNKFNNKIIDLQKELKDKDDQYQNMENKLNESIQNNKQLTIDIYYYWKTAHNINPGLISMYDMIDGIYKHFYNTTFNIEKNNFSHEILEKTIPFLIKRKQQQLLDNTIFR